MSTSPHLARAATPRPRNVEAQPDVPLDFEAVYDAYARFVWRALVHLGVAERDVEDLVQEVFVVIHRQLPGFQGRSSLRTWVYGIALGTARNHRRASTRHGWKSQRDDLASARVAVDAEQEPDEQLARKEAARIVAEVLETLDDDAREVFVLAELEELSANEIAEVLSLNVNTVSSRLRLARQAFERAVKRVRARDSWRMG